MTKLFIARVRGSAGDRPLVTVRAAAEGEAKLFLEAAYPEDEILEVAEPGEWVSTTDTGTKAGDCASIRARNGSRRRRVRGEPQIDCGRHHFRR